LPQDREKHAPPCGELGSLFFHGARSPEAGQQLAIDNAQSSICPDSGNNRFGSSTHTFSIPDTTNSMATLVVTSIASEGAMVSSGFITRISPAATDLSLSRIRIWLPPLGLKNRFTIAALPVFTMRTLLTIAPKAVAETV